MTHVKLKSLTLLTLTSVLAACAGRSAPVSKPDAGVGVATTAVARAANPAPIDHSAEIRDQLAKRRRMQIDRLRAYADAGVFPRNFEQPGMLNIFIDSEGAICAAANLMWKDGLVELVEKTALADNYLRLATVTSGPLYNWILGSGLTQHEVDRIQEPYEYIPDPQFTAAEAERLRAHFAIVLLELEANWDASLDSATKLVAADPALATL